MRKPLHRLRVPLYISVFVCGCCFAGFFFAAMTAYHTPTRVTNLTNTPERPVWDPVLIHLLVSTLAAWIFTLSMSCKEESSSSVPKWFQLSGLATLWGAWTGGIIASSILLSSFFISSDPTSFLYLQLMLVFGWLKWFSLTILIYISLRAFVEMDPGEDGGEGVEDGAEKITELADLLSGDTADGAGSGGLGSV